MSFQKPKNNSPLAWIKESLENHKALEIVTIPLAGKTDVADFFVVASGTSKRHMQSLIDYLVEDLKKQGVEPLRVEGAKETEWSIADFGDVVVHVFTPQVRLLYNLEEMWDVSFPTQNKTSS